MAIKIKEKIKVDPENLGLLDKLYDRIEALKEGKYTVYVLDEKPNRSLQQNRYYWGVVIKSLQEHTGIDAEDLHEFIKYRFNPMSLKQKVAENGFWSRLLGAIGIGKPQEELTLGASTKNLDTEQFMEMVERIRLWAIEELDFYIPLPQEVTGADYSDLYVQAMDLKV